MRLASCCSAATWDGGLRAPGLIRDRVRRGGPSAQQRKGELLTHPSRRGLADVHDEPRLRQWSGEVGEGGRGPDSNPFMGRQRRQPEKTLIDTATVFAYAGEAQRLQLTYLCPVLCPVLCPYPPARDAT